MSCFHLLYSFYTHVCHRDPFGGIRLKIGFNLQHLCFLSAEDHTWKSWQVVSVPFLDSRMAYAMGHGRGVRGENHIWKKTCNSYVYILYMFIYKYISFYLFIYFCFFFLFLYSSIFYIIFHSPIYIIQQQKYQSRLTILCMKCVEDGPLVSDRQKAMTRKKSGVWTGDGDPMAFERNGRNGP